MKQFPWGLEKEWNVAIWLNTMFKRGCVHKRCNLPVQRTSWLGDPAVAHYVITSERSPQTIKGMENRCSVPNTMTQAWRDMEPVTRGGGGERQERKKEREGKEKVDRGMVWEKETLAEVWNPQNKVMCNSCVANNHWNNWFCQTGFWSQESVWHVNAGSLQSSIWLACFGQLQNQSPFAHLLFYSDAWSNNLKGFQLLQEQTAA